MLDRNKAVNAIAATRTMRMNVLSMLHCGALIYAQADHDVYCYSIDQPHRSVLAKKASLKLTGLLGMALRIADSRQDRFEVFNVWF